MRNSYTKASRIYPYNKTVGERRHESLVQNAKAKGYKHPGSKNGLILHTIMEKKLHNLTYGSLNFLRRMF